MLHYALYNWSVSCGAVGFKTILTRALEARLHCLAGPQPPVGIATVLIWFRLQNYFQYRVDFLSARERNWRGHQVDLRDEPFWDSGI